MNASSSSIITLQLKWTQTKTSSITGCRVSESEVRFLVVPLAYVGHSVEVFSSTEFSIQIIVL